MEHLLCAPVTEATRFSLLQGSSALLSPHLLPTRHRSAFRAAVLAYVSAHWLTCEVQRAALSLCTSTRYDALLYSLACFASEPTLAPQLQGCWGALVRALEVQRPNPRRHAHVEAAVCGLLEGGHCLGAPPLPKLAACLVGGFGDGAAVTPMALRALAAALKHPCAESVPSPLMKAAAMVGVLGPAPPATQLQAQRCLIAWVHQQAQGASPPPWAHLLHRSIAAQLSVPEDAWVGSGSTAHAKGAAAAKVGSPREGRTLALGLLSACCDRWGFVWLLSGKPAEPPPPQVAAALGGAAPALQPPSPSGLKLLLLFARLVAVEVKECVDLMEELLILPSTSGGASAEEMAKLLEKLRSRVSAEQPYPFAGGGLAAPMAEKTSGEPRVPEPSPGAASPPAPGVSVPPMSRATRSALIGSLHSQLRTHFFSALEAYESLLGIDLGPLQEAAALAVSLPAAQVSQGSGGHPASSPASLLPPIRDTLSGTAGLLLAFPADAWNSNLRPALEALCSEEEGRAAASPGAVPAAAVNAGEDELASLPWRASLTAPLALAAGLSAARFLAEDEEARDAELLDALPLLFSLPPRYARRGGAAPPKLAQQLGDLGPLSHPLPKLLPALAMRMCKPELLAPLSSLGTRSACLLWLKTLCRGLAMDVMLLDTRSGGGAPCAAADYARLASLNARALSLGCVACTIAIDLSQPKVSIRVQWAKEEEGVVASAAKDLLATARRCASDRVRRGIAEEEGGRVCLEAFACHATALACMLRRKELGGLGAPGEAAQLTDAVFECFKGLTLDDQGGEGCKEGACLQASSAPFQELWADNDQLLHLALKCLDE